MSKSSTFSITLIRSNADGVVHGHRGGCVEVARYKEYQGQEARKLRVASKCDPILGDEAPAIQWSNCAKRVPDGQPALPQDDPAPVQDEPEANLAPAAEVAWPAEVAALYEPLFRKVTAAVAPMVDPAKAQQAWIDAVASRQAFRKTNEWHNRADKSRAWARKAQIDTDTAFIIDALQK